MDRLNSSVKKIKSYSVPEIDCEVKLDGNESPFALSPALRTEIEEKILSVSFNRYPDPNALSLKESACSYYGVDSEQIIFGNGSDELIQMLIETFTGKSGTVLVPLPTFSMYKLTSLLLGKNVTEAGLDKDFDLDIDLILQTIDREDPDIFFFPTPNNPTGNSFTSEKIRRVLDSTDGIVVVDEAYYDYHGKTFLPILKDHKNLVILRTMSKIGFASIRLGILFAHSELAAEINKARMPYNINSVTQLVAETVFENFNVLEPGFSEIKNERARVSAELDKISGIEVFPSDANFLLIRVKDADGCFGKLVEKGILVRNFHGSSGLDNCLRVTIGTPEENTKLLNAFSAIPLS